MPATGPPGRADTIAGARIPHSRPALGFAEKAAVSAVVDSGRLAQGPAVELLEARVARLLTRPSDPAAGGVAVASGTAALYVGLRALGVGAGDEVLVPAYACASLNQAVRFVGARPRFYDCDPATFSPDPEDAGRRVVSRTAACIVPHLFGLPADIEAFVELGIPIIEDCAQTLGVSVGGRQVGSFGDVTVCSFYATKLIAGGEGGLVVSPDPALLDRARELRDCEAPNAGSEAFNFKMSDLHAAVADAQLQRLDEFLRRRLDLATRYRRELRDIAVDLPPSPVDRDHAWFRFVVRLRNMPVDDLIERCDALGLACRRPVGRLVEGIDLSTLPGCRIAWESACSLPLYPDLSDAEAGEVMRRFVTAMTAR